jgi:hypothetical protein
MRIGVVDVFVDDLRSFVRQLNRVLGETLRRAWCWLPSRMSPPPPTTRWLVVDRALGWRGGCHRRWRTEKTAPSGSLSTAMRPTSARSKGATDTVPPSWPTRLTISSVSATAK